MNMRLEEEAKEYWATLGPGLTTGAADDDPSGIATYSEAGARYGLQFIWLALFTFPFMAAVQEMSARIGIVSGEGLAANIRRRYRAPVLCLVVLLLFGANVFNIAADLSAMAAAGRLILPALPALPLILAFALLSLLLQVFVSYARYARYLKYLSFALLSYVVVAFSVGLDWGAVLYHTLVPTFRFSADQLVLLAAVLGTTISPYLLFWQTSQEIEDEISFGERTIRARRTAEHARPIHRMRVDVWSGMLFSNLVTFFIFAAVAGTLHAHGAVDIESAAQAAAALAPFGPLALPLFALGIIGTGLLAVPVLAGSSAYAIAEALGWRDGLYRKFKQARAFYGVIAAAMALGALLDFFNLNPIRSLIWAAVANGVIAPFILYFVVRIAGDRRSMGEYASGRTLSALGWITIAAMALSGALALASPWL